MRDKSVIISAYFLDVESQLCIGISPIMYILLVKYINVWFFVLWVDQINYIDHTIQIDDRNINVSDMLDVDLSLNITNNIKQINLINYIPLRIELILLQAVLVQSARLNMSARCADTGHSLWVHKLSHTICQNKCLDIVFGIMELNKIRALGGSTGISENPREKMKSHHCYQMRWSISIQKDCEKITITLIKLTENLEVLSIPSAQS